MFTTFLQQLSTFFDRRWLLTAFFPTLFFCGAALAIVTAMSGIQAALQAWRSQAAEFQLAIGLGALVGIAIVAYALSNFQTALVRFFEGYWQSTPLLRRWGEHRINHYRRVDNYLRARTRFLNVLLTDYEAQRRGAGPAPVAPNPAKPLPSEIDAWRELAALDAEWLLSFPPDRDWLMPTMLGNILRAAEAYATKRYGMDSVVLWPRLEAFISDDLLKALSTARLAMDFMLVLSMLSFVFSTIFCPFVALTSNQWDLFLVCAAGFWLAWFCYVNALQSASYYGELIKTAFDLYRWKLLEGLHIQSPKSFDEERKVWADISGQIYRNYVPETALYEGAQPPAPPKKTWPQRFGEWSSAVLRITLAAAVVESQALLRGLSVLVVVGLFGRLVLSALMAGMWKVAGIAGTDEPPSPARLPAVPSRPRDLFGPTYLAVTFMVSIVVAYYMFQRPPPVRIVEVAINELAPGQVIDSASIRRQAAGADTRSEPSVVGCVAATPIPKDAVITASMVQPRPRQGCLAGTVDIGIPATSAMLLGDDLHKDDFVDVVIVPNATPVPGAAPTPIVFRDLLVRNVRLASDVGAVSKPPDRPFVIVLAVPVEQRDELVARSGSGTVFISRGP